MVEGPGRALAGGEVGTGVVLWGMARAAPMPGPIRDMFRIHGVMCVHDEADVLEEALDHILANVDALHVLDTGSTDGCWDIVQARARRDARLESAMRARVEFTNDMRGILFERARRTFRPGDWVARIDPDEFFVPELLAVDDPGHATDLREFLERRVMPHEGRVFARMFEFVITRQEADAMARGERVEESRDAVVRRRLAYVTDPVPEPRFFRFRKGMRWGPGNPNPFNPGVPARARLAIAHYRWRTLEQTRRRFEIRKRLGAITPHGTHWDRSDWREWLMDASDPRVRWRREGESLVGPIDENHLTPGWRGCAERWLHRVGVVGVADVTRRGWSTGEVRRCLGEWEGSGEEART